MAHEEPSMHHFASLMLQKLEQYLVFMNTKMAWFGSATDSRLKTDIWNGDDVLRWFLALWGMSENGT